MHCNVKASDTLLGAQLVCWLMLESLVGWLLTSFRRNFQVLTVCAECAYTAEVKAKMDEYSSKVVLLEMPAMEF